MGRGTDSACARAWRSALEEHADAWWSYALHLAGRHDDAEDLVHTMLTSVLERSIEPESVAPGYPYRVMRNAWVSDRRRKQTRREHLPRLAPHRPDAPRHDDRLDGALASLTDEQREVVVLKHSAGLTLEQIALATGRPLGTVAGQHRRALAALRERLAPPQEDGQ